MVPPTSESMVWIVELGVVLVTGCAAAGQILAAFHCAFTVPVFYR